MALSEFERFQQRVFDELDELERTHREKVVNDFVELGTRFRVDVVSEILDRGKSVPEVFETISRAQSGANQIITRSPKGAQI